MKFSIKDFFSKYDQIRRKLRIWSHLPKKSLMENFIFCAVIIITNKITNFSPKSPRLGLMITFAFPKKHFSI